MQTIVIGEKMKNSLALCSRVRHQILHAYHVIKCSCDQKIQVFLDMLVILIKVENESF
jgi:hypothetical protein